VSEKSKPKKSSVRHTRVIQRERTKRPNTAPPDAQIQARLTELIHPATYAQVATFHALGLRERILTLPVMMAFVLSLIWRHLGSVSEPTRVLREEGLLWASAQQVTQSAVEQRLRGLPPCLFQAVLLDLLPRLHERWLAPCAPRPLTSNRLVNAHEPLFLDSHTTADLQDRSIILDEYSTTMRSNACIMSYEQRKTISSPTVTWAFLQEIVSGAGSSRRV
jgi:hypothetical protein